MEAVEGLRSVYDLVGGVAHFGRMLDKVRLHAAGELPESYIPFLGAPEPTYFDGRVCRFLKVDYEDVAARTKAGGSDEEVLEWAFTRGRRPNAEEIEIFTAFLCKRGWRDEAVAGLRAEVAEEGLAGRGILTFADFKDAEEGRAPRFPAELPPFTGSVEPTLRIEGLRSPYEKLGGIAHFGRMLDKIRLHRAGLLPEEWVKAMGGGHFYDGYCLRFLGVDYGDLRVQALAEKNDAMVLEWAFKRGRRPSAEEILIWNAYMTKRNWRDAYTPRLHFRLEEARMPIEAARTMFEFIDLDEGRTPPVWE